MRVGALLLVVTTVACGEARDEAEACASSALTLADGTCARAGVPADGCGDGFAPDGGGGCAPILPKGPCGDEALPVLGDARCASVGPHATSLPSAPPSCKPGASAVPGDAECHEVSPCGSGRFGDDPRDAGTIHVDASAAAGGDGSESRPFATIRAAIDAAPPGSTIAVAEGSYVEALTIDKPLRLVGRCPRLVEIRSPSPSTEAVITIGATASVATVASVAITGGLRGVSSLGSDVRLERAWIHDTAGPSVLSSRGALAIRDSLFENAAEVGVEVLGGSAVIERLSVRDVRADTRGQFGRAISTETRGDVTLRRIVIEGALEIGVFATASKLAIEDSWVRDTRGRKADGRLGHGIQIERGASLALTRSVVERSHDVGVSVFGAAATLEDVLVTDVAPRVSDGAGGRGVSVEPHAGSASASSLTMRRARVARARSGGVVVLGATATIEDSAILDIQAQSSDGRFGRCLAAQTHAGTGWGSELTVARSAFGRCREAGLVVEGSRASIRRTWVHDIEPELASGRFGRGVDVRIDPRSSVPTDVVLGSSIVERAREYGIGASGAHLVVDGCLVRDIGSPAQPTGRGIDVIVDAVAKVPSDVSIERSIVERTRDVGVIVFGSRLLFRNSVVREIASVDGAFGDGLGVGALTLEGETFPGTLVVEGSLVSGAARAGVLVGGGALQLARTRLECAPVALDAETLETSLGPIAARLEDGGGNACGCGGSWSRCRAMSSGVRPVDPSKR